jgi:hypothetical protein
VWTSPTSFKASFEALDVAPSCQELFPSLSSSLEQGSDGVSVARVTGTRGTGLHQGRKIGTGKYKVTGRDGVYVLRTGRGGQLTGIKK